jgi:hypothetical protein
MSQNYRYSTAIAENSKDTFTENDNVVFMINGDQGMSLLKNSVRLEGNVKVFIGGNQVAAELVYFNPQVGAHGLVESMQVSTQSGLVENISNAYPRLVNMKEQATRSINDSLNGSEACELKMPTSHQIQNYCHGTKSHGNQAGSVVNDPMSFSFKPLCCLNRVASSSGNLPFSRVGSVKLQFILSRDLGFLYGNVDAASALTYELTNLKLSYVQVPSQDLDSQPQMCRSFVSVKQTLNSNVSSINAKLPSVVDAVSISFQKVADENTVRNDNLKLDNVDGLSRLEFGFNNSVEMIKYQIEDRGEMIQRGLNSFSYTGHNQLKANLSNKGSGFLTGLNFQLPKDLSQNSFNTLISTDSINNLNKYNVYLFFHSQLSL